MKIEVLGCGGSIGIPGEGTTAFLMDDDILIDAGTGVCNMSMAALEKIEHVFITHTHLDHICALPFLIDTVGVFRPRPLTVHASAASIASMQQHIFNNSIWPDFTRIPTPEKGVMQYSEIVHEQPVRLGHRTVVPVEVEHTVHAFGFVADDGGDRWAFSGDTHRTDRFYDIINAMGNVKRLFIEAAFPDKEAWIADLSKHLCPNVLFDELKKLNPATEVWISHLKPREYNTIKAQLLSPDSPQRTVALLAAGMVFDF